MKLGTLFFGDREFFNPEEIEQFIVNSKKFSDREELAKTASLLIFETSKQRTWLVTSSQRLYCILDDIREDAPHINWSMNKENILQDNNLAIELSTKNNSAETGLIDFGSNHKNWLYSKKLFTNIEIGPSVNQFIIKNLS